MDASLRESSPLIVVGMHRSGTRLLASMLSGLGVFMGADRQADAESVTFMQINEAIFHQCGTFWCEPMPVHVILAQPEHVERIAALALEALAARLYEYGGQADWRPEGVPAFGWKDPRNTFTLPVWRHLFPSCRVIHIVRHGVDAAASLARRHREACLSAAGGPVPSPLVVFQDHALGVLSSRRGWTLDEALTMWEQYVEKARIETAELGERAMEIRFEDLVARPAELVPRLARFCGVPEAAGGEATRFAVEPGRAFAYRQDPELAAFAEARADVLRRYGYES